MEEQSVYEASTKLTPSQAALLELVRGRVGEERRLLKAEIIQELAAQGLHVGEREIHQIVQDLRGTGFPVLASRRGGYFWPESAEQVRAFDAREIGGRAAILHKQHAAIMRNLSVWFGQMGA